ncbi:mannosyltransferase [Streptosporangium album]|uniref:Mannosyltransferase n=1 Tax=Streptosporangium album TaxID=47479 RepID=A0A7W7S1K5_9ACTN|nr:glycosyltransferase family 39 protein [Streptosporangium album]MBB4942205.1 mannosyltransferase [Streptosporangium album]
MSQSSDEMATLSAARRSATGLWELAQHVDGHFLPYYAFMHLWLEFGQAQWWLRLPSAIATGVAVALITDLGRRLRSLPAGVTAAAVYVLLPSVSYQGQNVRSYAFAAAAAVLATWALHRATEEPERRGGWWRYAAAVALLGCTQVFALLVLTAHLLAVALHGRGVLARMLAAVAVGCVPGAVGAVVGFKERHAISWIEMPDPAVFLALPRTVGGTAPAGHVLLALALAAPLLMRRHRPDRLWVTLLTGWALLPPILLFGLSHLAAPVYVDRYLFATVPAYALLAGLALAATPLPIAALALVTALAAGLPGQLDLRREDGHNENFPRAIRIISGEALPGDAIVYAGSWLRTGMLYYGGRDLADDVLLMSAAPRPDSFDYPERADVAAALDGYERVWVLWRGGARKPATGSDRIDALLRAGFTRSRAWHVGRAPGMTVMLQTRRADLASRTAHRRRRPA